MTLIVSGRQYKLALLGSRPLNATVNSRDRDHPAAGHELYQEPIIYTDIRQQDRAPRAHPGSVTEVLAHIFQNITKYFHR